MRLLACALFLLVALSQQDAIAQASSEQQWTLQQLPDFCDLSSFKFAINDGDKDGVSSLLPKAVGNCDAVSMNSSSSSEGMAAGFVSPVFPITPGRLVKATYSVKTVNLVPIPGGDGAGAASLTGGVYFHFQDVNGDFGAWNPQFGTHAPPNTDWTTVETQFVIPTTAATAQFYLAFGAHSSEYAPNRMLSGRARGDCFIGNVSFEDLGPATPLPSTITVPDPIFQAAINQSFSCLHNSKQSGNFTVGAGYTISGNISPDLTFGLHGIRRTGHPSYVAQIQKQWEYHQPSTSGEYTVGRVMGQVNWPLGVDNLFSFTGNVSYMEEKLPYVDASFDYVDAHADDNGLATLIPVGKGRIGGGCDWVDWYTTRISGRTFQFHLWYAFALDRFSSIHEEFASTFGNATKATIYKQRAVALREVLQSHLWNNEDGHWWTNPDFKDEGEWLDDSVWSIYYDVANESQAQTIWNRIDGNLTFYEGVPIRWTAFQTNHGKCSWFGRLGGGDIMARYKHNQSEKATALLNRISSLIAQQHDIYEGYDMTGCGLQKCGCTTSGFGDYLEHCGGLIWTFIEGLFGIDFVSSPDWVATFTPRFPSDWSTSSATVYIRGSSVSVTWSKPAGETGRLTLLASESLTQGNGEMHVRVVGCNIPEPYITTLTLGTPSTFEC